MAHHHPINKMYPLHEHSGDCCATQILSMTACYKEEYTHLNNGWVEHKIILEINN
jgi:hypothetical protein